jgi:hypothetical protein
MTATCKAQARTALTLAVVVAAAVLGGDTAAQDRGIGGIGLTVFADSGMRGANATFREDVPDFVAYRLNDRVSSLEVGPGELWEVCEHANYEGRCQVFSGSIADLRESGWSDIISSARRVRAGRGRGTFPSPPARARVELFARPRFAGDSRTINDAIPNLQAVGFNDQAVSLRLAGGETWEVCVDANYQNCVVVTSNWDDLSGLGMIRRISSLRPWRQAPGPGGRGTRPGEPRLVVYDERSYRGAAFILNREAPRFGSFANRAESVQVQAGTWELCDEPEFQGRCSTVTADVPDLGRLRLLNRVNSARPVE